jgi:hypothetical protein
MTYLAVLWLKKVAAPSLQVPGNLFPCVCLWMLFPNGEPPGLAGKLVWQNVLLGLM